MILIKRLFVLICGIVAFCGCSGTRPDFVGKGVQHPCPSSPNCVSTKSSTAQHGIEPIPLTISGKDAIDSLAAIITGLDRTKIVLQKDNYLYAEFTSSFWKFVDDVEFFIDTTNNIIQFRSSSRLGHSDMGVNRERMEKIRSLYTQ